MIDLYAWYSPNVRKVAIMLEECALPYRLIPIALDEGEHRTANYASINPNQRVPAIVDHDAEGGALTLAESGAILIYLAEKTGQLLPAAGKDRAKALQWLMFQMSHIGPTLGQADHFLNFADEKLPYAIKRFVAESLRVLGVLNAALSDREFLAGDYSIADIATLPWVDVSWSPLHELAPEQAQAFTSLARWREALLRRPLRGSPRSR